jgi:Uma2 family endonuclease
MDMDTDDFDPLVEFYGKWTMELAERYLPIPGVPASKYECWDGRLYMAPAEAAQNSFGALRLGRLLIPGAEAAGFYVYGPVNLGMGQPDRWLQPDLTILRSPETGTWVSSDECLMPIEFVSPDSRRRDLIHKPLRYAERGIPWYMTVEVDNDKGYAVVALYRLGEVSYVPVARALAGQRFEMTVPFEAAFDPGDLLVR